MVKSNVFTTLVRKLVKRHINIYLEEYINTRERGVMGTAKVKLIFIINKGKRQV